MIKPIEHNDPTPSLNFEFPIFEAEEGDVKEILDEITRLLEHEEKIIQPHLENLETVNLGSEDCVREVKIGALLEESVKKGLIDFLREYVDVFAWSYEDMPGQDTDIVQHFLPLKPECVPVKQKLRRTHPDMAVKIKEEVQKQIDVGFLVTSTYPQWMANIVPVPKKDGKVRMCVDYRDLNKASPKDDFPLPHIDMLVDNTAKFNVFSFMDGFSGYNQGRKNMCRITRKTGGKKKQQSPPCVIYPKGGKGNARSKPGKDMVSRPEKDGIGSRLCEGKVLAPLRIRRTRRDPRTKE
ncbi:hypothetical protein KIW84_034634 [Lathyrus oleraceus]|uniref:Reverse transcriptase domain-containing protein n=1 Tax=Pisum sativum TaxID=3888 RepID=A0A9D5AZN3_PEA|nr:hypothetical protein KIW84_034634 [Pisum sativum]